MRARNWSIVALLLVALVGATYYLGRRAGARDVRGEIRADSVHNALHTLELTAPVLRAQHQSAQVEERKDSTAKVRYTAVRSHVHVANDSQVVVASIDSAVDSTGVLSGRPTVDTLTSRLGVQLIESADALIAQDSVVNAARLAENGTLYQRDSVHTTVERLQQETLDDAKPRRCGRRCGIVLGASAVYAATHPGQIVKAVTWILRLVH